MWSYILYTMDIVIILYTMTYFFMVKIPRIVYRKYLLMEMLPKRLIQKKLFISSGLKNVDPEMCCLPSIVYNVLFFTQIFVVFDS